MNILPSATIRQNYNKVAKLCRETSEPVFLTKNGEGDLVVMDIVSYERQRKLGELWGELTAVESARRAGVKDISLNELDKYLDNVIEESSNLRE